MYEEQTFETIMQRMLARVPNNIDKREGSVIWNAIAPAAAELAQMYVELDIIMRLAFADTSSGEYLSRRAAEIGVERKPATKAKRKGIFYDGNNALMDVPIGSRFRIDDVTFVITEQIGTGEFVLECETPGTIGNSPSGTMLPIEYIDGLTSAELTAVLIPGEDEEDTEALRQRYLNSFEKNPYGGNKQDYIQKTNSIAGVGSTKVTPIWNGGGTVKLTILDSDFNKASSVLIDTVQEKIDPTNSPGQGLGVAPIGHVVTVDTATEVIINIATTLTFDTGYNFDMLQADIIAAMEAYMLEIRTNWANQDISYVRIAQIETRILAIEKIIDISGTMINSLGENFELDRYEIPVLGVVTAL